MIKEDIKENPILYIFMSVLCTALSVFAASTFATMDYVDKRNKEVKMDIKIRFDELKRGQDKINDNILNLYKKNIK